MARPVNPRSPYLVSVHRLGGYRYASTQPAETDPATGKKRWRHAHWGRLEAGDRLVPGKRWLDASPEERAMLIFPEGWDLSLLAAAAGEQNAPDPGTGEGCRFYGDMWLLETLASDMGVTDALRDTVFAGAGEDALATLALACDLLADRWPWDALPLWQRLVAAPGTRALDAAFVAGLLGRVTEQSRRAYAAARAAWQAERPGTAGAAPCRLPDSLYAEPGWWGALRACLGADTRERVRALGEEGILLAALVARELAWRLAVPAGAGPDAFPSGDGGAPGKERAPWRDALAAMRPVLLVRLPGRGPRIAGFGPEQAAVCRALGIAFPEGGGNLPGNAGTGG